MPPDIESMTGELLTAIEGLIEKRCAPLIARATALQAEVDEIKAREPLKGEPGKDAEVDYTKVWTGCADLIKQQIDALPKPDNGKDGASVTVEDVRPMLEKMVGALPPAKDGESVHPDTVRVMIAEEVVKAFAGVPKPDNGKDADPIVMAKMVTDEVARQFDLVRPHIKGQPGEPGAPGFSLEDFAVELKGDRTLVFKFARGDVTKECEVVGTWPVDTGPFKVEEGAEYTRGDGVSYKGCWWIAQAPTKDVPGTSKSWRMAVKAGRDGKDFNAAAPSQREPMRLR